MEVSRSGPLLYLFSCIPRCFPEFLNLPETSKRCQKASERRSDFTFHSLIFRRVLYASTYRILMLKVNSQILPILGGIAKKESIWIFGVFFVGSFSQLKSTHVWEDVLQSSCQLAMRFNQQYWKQLQVYFLACSWITKSWSTLTNCRSWLPWSRDPTYFPKNLWAEKSNASDSIGGFPTKHSLLFSWTHSTKSSVLGQWTHFYSSSIQKQLPPIESTVAHLNKMPKYLRSLSIPQGGKVFLEGSRKKNTEDVRPEND